MYQLRSVTGLNGTVVHAPSIKQTSNKHPNYWLYISWDIKNKEKKTGCTVHFVNEKLDAGNIITQKYFFINSNDNEKTLKKKTQRLEYKVFPEAIIKIFRNN